MFRKYALKSSVWHKPDIEFEWDADSGALRGRDADLVREQVQQAIAAGSIVSHPYPTHYEISNPLAKLDELAIVLGQYWQLSEELAKYLPAADPEEEYLIVEDPDGKNISIEILH